MTSRRAMPKCFRPAIACARVTSPCVRRRSRGAVELNDMIAFLVEGAERQADDVDPGRLAGARDRQRLHRHSLIPGLRLRPLARRLSTTLLPLAAATTFGASFALAAAPNLCDHGGQWAPPRPAHPPRSSAISIRSAMHASTCAPPARTGQACFPSVISPRRHAAQQSRHVPPRLIVFPAEGGQSAPARRMAQANRVRPQPRTVRAISSSSPSRGTCRRSV